MAMEHSKLRNSLPCPDCPAKCPDKDALKLHRDKAHNSRVYECPHCSAVFSRWYHVSRHLRQKGCDGKDIKVLNCKVKNILLLFLFYILK